LGKNSNRQIWREKNGPEYMARNITCSKVESRYLSHTTRGAFTVTTATPSHVVEDAKQLVKDRIHYFFFQCENNPDAWQSDCKHFG
jgi:hypothetical protein